MVVGAPADTGTRGEAGGDVDVRSRWVLHFTHVDNLPSIVAAGALRCDGRAQRGDLTTEVGDRAIKANRRNRKVPVGAHGTVGEYVPFYFAPRSPMMYRIACDCRGATPGRYQGGDRPLVYLASTMGALVDARLDWAATDGNAASSITRFTTDLDEMAQTIDWPLMRADRWHNTPDDPDRQRRRMAEVLVHDEVPLGLFHGLAAYSEREAHEVRLALGDHPLARRVNVRPHWYYGYTRR